MTSKHADFIAANGAAGPVSAAADLGVGGWGRAVALTHSDTVDLAQVAAALYIGVAGDVKVDMETVGTVTFKAVPVGLLPVRAKRVYAAGTTATNILALN